MNRLFLLMLICLSSVVTPIYAQSPSDSVRKEIERMLQLRKDFDKQMSSLQSRLQESYGENYEETYNHDFQDLNVIKCDKLDSIIEEKIQTYNSESVSKEDDQQFSFCNLLSCLAFIIACYAAWTVRSASNKKKSEHRGGRAGSSGNGTSKADENYATINYVLALERKIDDISRRISSTTSNIKNPEPLDKDTKGYRPPIPPKNITKKFFASQVQSEGIPLSSISEKEDDYSFIVLNISKETGSFSISTNPSAQEYVIRNFNYTAAPVCQVKEQPQSPSRIVTVIPGQVKLEGNMWKIVVKAIVKLI